MNVKELRDFLTELPEELDNYEVVFSEVAIIDEEDQTWARKDIPLSSIAMDSDHEEMIVATADTIDTMLKLSGQLDEDENQEITEESESGE